MGEDLETPLSIYRLSPFTSGDADSLLIIEMEEQTRANAFIVTGFQDIDGSTQDLNYTLLKFYNTSQIVSENIPSPNGLNFYRLERNRLAIYSQVGEVMSEFDLGDRGDYVQAFEMGGWAPDSSGVYFKFPTTAGLALGVYNQEPIRKLLVVPE